MPVLRYAGAGLALGAAWGAAARVWMSALSSGPSVTSRGTVSVMLAAGLAGTMLGLAHGAGMHGGTGRWRAFALPAVALFLGAGLVLLPAFLLGGWSVRRGRMGRDVALVTVAAAPLLLLSTMAQRAQDGLVPFPGAGTLALVLAGSTVLALAAALGGSAAFGPWRPNAGRPCAPGVRVAPVTDPGAPRLRTATRVPLPQAALRHADGTGLPQAA